MPNLIGTAPNQIPTNGDLGSIAQQDSNNVNITGGSVAVNFSKNQGYFQDTNISDITPSLMFDFVNGKQVDSRLKFTRKSYGAFYDGIQNFKTEENLLLYSQNFSKWSSSTSDVSIATNTYKAPDGTVTASVVEDIAVSGLHNTQQSVTFLNQGSAYTYSLFAKQITTRYIILTAFNSGSVSVYCSAVFDLQTGVVVRTTTSGGGNYIQSANISAVANGWYRCSLTFIPGTLISLGYLNTYVGFAPCDAPATDNYGYRTFTGTGSLLAVWGAQLEQSIAPTQYTKTDGYTRLTTASKLSYASVDSPRIDFNPITLECNGLLNEESRTNLVSYSYDYSSYGKGQVTVLSKYCNAPDGTLTASKLCMTSTGQDGHYMSTYFAFTAGVPVTASFYAKAGEYSRVGVSFSSYSIWTGANGGETYFDLKNGTISYLNPAGQPYSATMTPVGGGWFRCTMTAIASSGSGTNCNIFVNAGTTFEQVSRFETGDGFSGLYVWGVQVEHGYNASSYIPTNGSQVTRSAESSAIYGDDFNKVWNPQEGTFFASFTPLVLPSDVYGDRIIGAVNPITTEYCQLIIATSGGVSSIKGYNRFFNVAGSSDLTINSINNAAMAYKSGDSAICANGNPAVGGNNKGSVSSATQFLIGGEFYSATFFNGYIRKLAYYPKRLSNLELQEMTL